jgi:hypothetical protein
MVHPSEGARDAEDAEDTDTVLQESPNLALPGRTMSYRTAESLVPRSGMTIPVCSLLRNFSETVGEALLDDRCRLLLHTYRVQQLRIIQSVYLQLNIQDYQYTGRSRHRSPMGECGRGS